VRTVQRGLPARLRAPAMLLGAPAAVAALAAGTGVGPLGRAVGLGCGTLLAAWLTVALHAQGRRRLGPADRVTLVRATLTCAVAALVADSFRSSAQVAPLVGLTVVALVLDAVDGRVARRTGTVSRFGARFDMEADAFLILVLSVYVARSTGPWVLTSGLARYALLVAGLALPWLRRPTPPRYWGKVVAATQGVVLAVAAADLLPAPVTGLLLAGALLLLVESFGRQVWWLARHRRAVAPALPARPEPVGLRGAA
jgi:phosphatidylglycerophosphate synthase